MRIAKGDLPIKIDVPRGDIFYWPARRSVRVNRYAEVILFSPQVEHAQVMDHMLAKLARLRRSRQRDANCL